MDPANRKRGRPKPRDGAAAKRRKAEPSAEIEGLRRELREAEQAIEALAAKSAGLEKLASHLEAENAQKANLVDKLLASCSEKDKLIATLIAGDGGRLAFRDAPNGLSHRLPSPEVGGRSPMPWAFTPTPQQPAAPAAPAAGPNSRRRPRDLFGDGGAPPAKKGRKEAAPGDPADQAKFKPFSGVAYSLQ